MNLMESAAKRSRVEFANSAQMGDQPGVHISLTDIGAGMCAPATNLFLPLGQAARLLIQMQRSLAHAYREAPDAERALVADIAEHEDSMARGMAALGHPPGPMKTLEFLTGRR